MIVEAQDSVVPTDVREGAERSLVQQRLREVYDPQIFRTAAEQLTEKLSRYYDLARCSPSPVQQWEAPPVLVEKARRILHEGRGLGHGIPDVFGRLAQTALSHSQRLHSPRFMGHQVAPAVPLAGLFDWLGSGTNQATGVYEMGPFATATERALVAEMGQKIGWKEGTFDGIATSGGSLANLTAILTARNIRYPDSWARGAGQTHRPTILAGKDSHYCISRAAGILGLGTDQLLLAPLDSCRRTDLKKMKGLLDQARLEGRDIFCLVGSAGSTPTGAFDSLRSLGEFAKSEGLWFHVDGAHGASALMSRRHRHLVDGLELADSVVWDAHKMLFVSSLCTFLFFKDKAHSFKAFQQEAPYLLDPEGETSAYDGAVRTVECTKRSMTLGLWGIWSAYGPQLFEDLVDESFAKTWDLYGLLKEASDFDPVHAPQSNILCFRYVPARLQYFSPDKRSEFHKTLRERLIRDGRFYLTGTVLEGERVLRVTMMNPLSTMQDLKDLLEEVRRVGQSLLK